MSWIYIVEQADAPAAPQSKDDLPEFGAIGSGKRAAAIMPNVRTGTGFLTINTRHKRSLFQSAIDTDINGGLGEAQP